MPHQDACKSMPAPASLGQAPAPRLEREILPHHSKNKVPDGTNMDLRQLSRNTYFEAKCLSVLAGRFVEVLQFPPVKPCEVRTEMTKRKFRLTEYFVVVFLITWIHLVVYVPFKSFQYLIIQAPKPSKTPRSNYL